MSIVIIKRASFDSTGISIAIQLIISFVVVVYFTNFVMESRYPDAIIYFICGTNAIIIALYYTSGIKFLPYYLLFDGNSTDLFKGFIFRTPGIFNEPSTMCYILLFLYIFSSQSKIITTIILFTVFISTSLGGILSFSILILRKSKFFAGAFLTGLFIIIFSPAFLKIPYISERLTRLIRGEDGSVSNRLASLVEFDLTLFGMQSETIETLYQHSSVKGLGFLSNILAYTGLFGVIIIVMILLYQKQQFQRLIFLSFSKFDLIEPISLLALIMKKAQK